jgi:UDP-N-acetylmuramate dehydrogenase
MSEATRTIDQLFGEALERDQPMSRFTTTGIGGPARHLVRARTQGDLARYVGLAREAELPYLLLGGGSNLLVSDHGIDSLVIRAENTGIDRKGDVLTVQAGTALQELVDYTVSHGLDGMHRMTGIPGTVGGAVYGNAGAYGQTISDHLEEAIVFDGRAVVSLAKAQCGFGYRHSAFKANRFVVLAARFRLPAGDPRTLAADSNSILSQRLLKYPVGLRCPGSFFMNVPVDRISSESLTRIPTEKVLFGKVPAGYLLEQVGAKGQRLGDIEIARSNANLFMNVGEGRAADFWHLAAAQAAKVNERFAITLIPEVQLINLPPIRVG